MVVQGYYKVFNIYLRRVSREFYAFYCIYETECTSAFVF